MFIISFINYLQLIHKHFTNNLQIINKQFTFVHFAQTFFFVQYTQTFCLQIRYKILVNYSPKNSEKWYNTLVTDKGSGHALRAIQEENKMKMYEVTITDRKNTIWSNIPLDEGKVTYIVAAENKQQAIDFSFELFQPEYRMSRDKVKITAERFNG